MDLREFTDLYEKMQEIADRQRRAGVALADLIKMKPKSADHARNEYIDRQIAKHVALIDHYCDRLLEIREALDISENETDKYKSAVRALS